MLVSEFIAAVRQQAKLPTNVADAAILRAGDMEIQARLLPAVRKVHADYLVRELTATSLNGRVAMPTRAVVATVRKVQLILSGASWSLPNFGPDEDVLASTTGTPSGFMFDGQDIVLLPRGSSGTVRVMYYVRPGRMIAETDTANTRVVTAGTFNTDGSASLTIGGTIATPTLLDVVSSGPAHAQCALDITNPASATIAVSATQAIGLMRVGDYVVAADRSPFVPLPEEMASALVHQASAILLRSNGYESEASAQRDLAEAAIAEATQMLVPRSEGNPKMLRGGLRSRIGLGRAIGFGWRR